MSAENSFFIKTDKLELKTEDDKDFIIGYISTPHVDLVNDVVTKGCMEGMVKQLKSRNIKLDIEHETWRGDATAKTIMPAARIVEATQDDFGVKIKALMNPDYKRFDGQGSITLTAPEVKRNIQNGFYDAFSIAYIPTKAKRESVDGKVIRKLDELNLMNVALTGNPVNPHASMTEVLMKSLDYLGDEMDKTNKEIEVKDAPTPEVAPPMADYAKEIKALTDRLSALESEFKGSVAKKEVVKPEDEEDDEEKKKKKPEEKAIAPELKSERIEAMEKEIAELKAFLNTPQYKAVVENMKQKLDVAIKTASPLDRI